MKLIAEIDYKFKTVKLYLGSAHLASCYPQKSQKTMRYNIYKYFSGQQKEFNDHIYVEIDTEGVPLTADNVRKLEQQALDMARAKQSLKTIKSNI